MAEENKSQEINYEAAYKYIVDTLTTEVKNQEAALTHIANCFEYLKATVSVEVVKGILAFITGLTETK